MRNVSLFWTWLLVSIIGLTWFWHWWVFFLLMLCIVVFLFVKNMLSWLWLWCLFAWSLFAIGSVLYSLSPDISIQSNIVEVWQSIQVQMLKRLKPDTMQASLVIWWEVTSTSFLVQWSELDYTPWTVVQLIVWKIITPLFPSITTIWPIVWHPSEFDYSRWLAMKSFDGHIQTSFHIQLPHSMNPYVLDVDWKATVSQRLHNNISSTYTPRSAWLLEWMIIGWRAWVEKTEYENFITSWLVHIIAVSWSNIMMVVVLLGMLLFRVPFYIRILCIWLIIIAYSIVAWLDSSVMRALVMWCTMLLALMVWRRISIRRSIWYACIFLLLVNPWALLYDLGFTLSFGALIGILLLDRRVTSLWVQSKLAKYVIPSVGAALGTLPVLISVMWSINILSPFVNILVVFFVPIALLLWVAWIIIWWHVVTLVEWIANSFFRIAQWSTQHALMLEVSGLLSKIVFITILVSVFRVLYILNICLLQTQERSVNG